MRHLVAIPLIAAICLGSPALASNNPEEQMVKGRGARDRNGGGGSNGSGGSSGGGSEGTATRSGGDRRSGDNRSGDRERTTSERRRDDGDQQRQAVQRAPDRDRSNQPVIVRRSRPTIVNVNNYGRAPYRPRYYAPAYYHRWAGSYYGWSPLNYAPWPLIYSSVGFANFGFYTAFGTTYPYAPYAYAPYAPYAYSPWQVSGSDIGGVRLKIQPRDAQVFVDGSYAGLVDDFDGTFQSLRLQQGGHKIELHKVGFEDLDLDVYVQPGKTLTLSETMRPRP